MRVPGRTRTPRALPAGTTIGNRYRIDGRLGSGGMASVFAGHDTALDRPVALKLLRVAVCSDERATQRLLREAKAMARVVHPDCVQVFDGGTDPEHGPFLVMERLEGEDLSRFLRARGPLPASLALGIMQQLCSTVQAVHDARMLHRDLKPANVFVLRHAAGAVPRIKLLDFGIAKMEDDDANLTEPGDILGTLVYMAPERWLPGNEGAVPAHVPVPVDVRADVYALGAILYEMLSGLPLFRADTKAALRLAVLNDPPEPLRTRRPDVPVWLAAALDAALSKAAADRPNNVRAFSRALGVALSGAVQPPLPAHPFLGTTRFRVQHCLFQGADTEVYAADDLQRGHRVAIKRMRTPGGEAAFRLKQEFRIASEIHHRNLVRLDALWEEDRQGGQEAGQEAGQSGDGHADKDLLLAMELVEGVSPLDYAAGSPERLRSCVRQLVRGLSALHQHGLAHCDVKPQNILVQASGRLVLLDCGLTSRWQVGGGVRGTTTYLAPEVLEGRIGPEADLFAVGVIVFQALSGRLPPVGASEREPSGGALEALPADSPADLRELCRRLLHPNPASRPNAAAVLSALGAQAEDDEDGDATAVAARGLLPQAPDRREVFVGRRDVLRGLVQSLAGLTAATEPRLVWLEGASGIGKSAVLDQFRRHLDDDPNVLVLAGRARQRDSVPFPAIDEAIDALGTFLARLPLPVAEMLLPKRLSHLARLFPTLTRVPAIARVGRVEPALRDAVSSRQHAFEALRELLVRLCNTRPVVLLIDDLQWIDADSRALLVYLLGDARPAPLLFVGAHRDGEGDMPQLQKLKACLPSPPQQVALHPLDHEESCALLRARWPGDSGPDRALAARLAEEGHGVPFFLELLAANQGSDLRASQQSAEARLDDVLTSRHLALPPAERRALELACLSSRPLPIQLILDAVGPGDACDADALVSAKLVRAVRVDSGWALEPSHDKIRDAVKRTLTAADARAHHRRLASRLKTQPASDPEVLIEHLAGGGDLGEAAAAALNAARTANQQMAFDRAAAFFSVALEHDHAPLADDARVAIMREQALALRHAGRRRECGNVLLQAADEVSEAEVATALRREGGTHLLYSGDVQRGLEILAPAIARAGLSLPGNLEQTVTATGAALAALGQRGFAVAAAPAETAGAAGAAGADGVDLCLDLAQGLAHIDLRVLPFACQALLRALELGDPVRLQRACALFVINVVEYVPNPLVAPALALCRALTEANPAPPARALLDAAVAENAHFEGDFLAAEAAFEHAERTLLESCVGATRELATVRDLAVFIQYSQKGDFKTQLGRTQRWLAEADAAHDVFHASMLRVAHAIVWIAHDQPRRARADLRRAQAEWLGEAGVLEVAAALYHDIIDRYEEQDLTGEPPSDARSSLLRSPAAQTPFLSGYLGLQSAWTDLRAMASGRRDAGPAVREVVVRLRGLGLVIWSAVADALAANLDYLEGHRERAVRGLDQAEKGFRSMSMSCLAACARMRRGQFIDGEVGCRLRDEADAELRSLGVADVARWTRTYWSMFDATAAALRTQNGTDDGTDDGTEALLPR